MLRTKRRVDDNIRDTLDTVVNKQSIIASPPVEPSIMRTESIEEGCMTSPNSGTADDDVERLVPLGLEIHRIPLAHPTLTGDTQCEDPPEFRAELMHQVISTQLFCSTVLFDIKLQDIAQELDMDPHAFEEIKSVNVAQTVDDEADASYHDHDNHEEILENDVDEEIKSDGRFAELFRSSADVADDVKDFAAQLTTRLNALAALSSSTRLVNKRRRVVHTENVNVQQDTELVSAKLIEDEGNRCGFSSSGHHDDIKVLCNGFAIVKTGGGLYRSARAAYNLSGPLHGSKDEPYSYFEVYVVEDCGKDGMCIGVATTALPLNKLVGSDLASVGLHSTGNIVSGSGAFEPYGESFKAGDRVGCLVRRHKGDLPPHSCITSFPSSLSASCASLDTNVANADDCVELTFFVNGRRQPTIFKAIQTDSKEDGNAPELFPTLSLYQKESKAVLCCCPEDWKYAPRAVRRGGGKSLDTSELADTTASLCSP